MCKRKTKEPISTQRPSTKTCHVHGKIITDCLNSAALCGMRQPVFANPPESPVTTCAVCHSVIIPCEPRWHSGAFPSAQVVCDMYLFSHAYHVLYQPLLFLLSAMETPVAIYLLMNNSGIVVTVLSPSFPPTAQARIY